MFVEMTQVSNISGAEKKRVIKRKTEAIKTAIEYVWGWSTLNQHIIHWNYKRILVVEKQCLLQNIV